MFSYIGIKKPLRAEVTYAKITIRITVKISSIAIITFPLILQLLNSNLIISLPPFI
jgi:hypothetical protein